MLYQIRYDGQDDYVEATDYAEAVTAWRAAVEVRWKAEGCWEDGDTEVMPEQVVCLDNDHPVIRAP